MAEHQDSSLPERWQRSLTDRQQEILSTYLDSLDERQVAKQLRLRPQSVINHLNRIQAKLRIASRANLVRLASPDRAGGDSSQATVNRVPDGSEMPVGRSTVTDPNDGATRDVSFVDRPTSPMNHVRRPAPDAGPPFTIGKGSCRCRSELHARYHDLPLRERQVLDLYLGGLDQKQIAHSLRLAHSTVRNHLAHIRERFRVDSLHELTCLLKSIEPPLAPRPADPPPGLINSPD